MGMSVGAAVFCAAAAAVTAVAAAQGLPAPLSDADYAPVDEAQAALGQLLFYDPIVSGNRNISCATCHHPRFATGDGVSLGIGEGGVGLGPQRRADPDNAPEQRIPRHAPALFNLGAHEMTVLFADGRIEADPSRPSGFRTPLGEEMTAGFANLLSAQTMFPVLSADEMAGHYQENDVAKAVRQGRITGEGGAWDIIAGRVAGIDAYAAKFAALDPDMAAGAPITFTAISDAIAAFMALEWRSDTSPFDAFLRGEAALSHQAARGLTLFYGPAGCAGCHTGPLLTDHAFHAMGEPQLGPGKAARFERHQRDIGRMRVTGRAADAYAFRTPSLRNVARTAPYGHAGAHADLAAFVRHHADPVAGLATYRAAAILPPLRTEKADWAIMNAAGERAAIAAAVTTEPAPLTNAQIADIVAFLGTLTDEAAIGGRLGVPDEVPSGLPVDR